MPIECHKWRTDDALEDILKTVHEAWNEELLPSELEYANVVVLGKKRYS